MKKKWKRKTKNKERNQWIPKKIQTYNEIEKERKHENVNNFKKHKKKQTYNEVEREKSMNKKKSKKSESITM